MLPAIVDDGRLRPWPVRVTTPENAEFFETVARDHGTTLAALVAQMRMALPHDNAWTRSLMMANAAWHAHGRQSFRVAPLLVEALLNTSLNLVPAAALRAPYSASWVEAELLLSHDLPPFYGFFLLAARTGEDPIFDDVVSRRLVPPDTHVLVIVARGPDDVNLVSDVFLCRETLETSIDESIRIDNTLRSEKGAPSLDVDSRDPMLRTLWSFTANFLLYLSSPDPDLQPVLPSGMEKPPKTAKAREIQARIRKREGSVQALGFRLTRVVRRGEGKPSNAMGTRAVAAHLVMGHWKQQPHGPQRSERKLIYIWPYRRGEGGDEERIERTYVL